MSTIQQHLHDSAPGVIGTSVAGGFTVAGFVSSSIPFLQAISLLVGIAVGVVTFVYYWRRTHK
jgi:hypothetical protein